MATILVVDDELGIRGLLSEILSDEGHTVELAEDASEARAARDRVRPDLVLLDIWMPDVDGISLLKEWGANGQLSMPVIMMSGHGTIDTAVEATKYGATAFLEKPITLQKLLRAVEQALVRPVPRQAGLPAGQGPGAGLIGGSLGSPGGLIGAAGGLLPRGQEPMGIGYDSHGAGLPVGGAPALASGPRAEQSFDLDRPLREARDAFEKSYFEFHLAKENGSMTRVAEKTGLERTHLYRKLKQLGVDLTRNKRGLS
ncbi:response regulator [Aquabacterium sp. OR-4]|uniref:response regulator n=1 Tax=Aquabacterium sp. OR-4 TaxID=2978127 RepID=UPI0021B3D447|nr:response regulator [Aquabacterium sp. OR-4]MDT7834091.1 response regulator [Aquabacterium sp. OR-4]